AFSPQGNVLLSSDADGVKLWDATTWTVSWRSPAAASATRLGFSADGRWFVAIYPSNGFAAWRVDGGKPVRTAWNPGGAGAGSNVAISPTRPGLVAAVVRPPARGTVTQPHTRVALWSAGGARPMMSGPRDIGVLAFSRDGTLLALAGETHGVRLLDV